MLDEGINIKCQYKVIDLCVKRWRDNNSNAFIYNRSNKKNG